MTPNPRLAPHLSWLFIVPAIPLLNLYFSDQTAFPYLAVGVYALIGIVAGIVLHKPARLLPWSLLAGGVGLWVLGDLIWYLPGPEGPSTYPSVADAVYLLGYPLIVVALGLLLWEGARHNSAAILDAALITIGVGVLVWMQGIAPYFDGESAASNAVSVTYLVLDLLLVGLTVRLLLSGIGRSVSSLLLTVGLLMLVFADLASYLLATDAALLWDLLDAGWLLSYLAMGAAALHPSITRKLDSTDETVGKTTWPRLLALAAGGLVVPLSLVPHILEGGRLTLLGPVVGASLFFALTFVRMRWLVRSLENVNRKLTKQGKRLQEAERRYRTLVEQTPAVSYVVAVGNGVRLLYVSPQVKDILGYDPHELIDEPMKWMEIVHPDDLSSLLDADTNATQLDLAFRMIAKDGSIVWASNRVSLISDEGGEQHWQGIFLDISDSVRIEELEKALARERDAVARLQSLDEMKNGFLQAVSHELRTPLTAIRGLGATLELRLDELTHADITDLVARINTNAERLEKLLADLLDVDRLSRGVFVPNYVTTDIGAIVERVAERFRLEAAQNITVECGPSEALTDPPKIERIAENLISNAIKHTSREAAIWIRVTRLAENVLITVEDSGDGVQENKKELIFEPFGQWDSEASHSQGLGLGLSLVRRFAELLEGEAWVEERRGGGASFKVWLPVKPSGAKRSRGPSAPEATSSPASTVGTSPAP